MANELKETVKQLVRELESTKIFRGDFEKRLAPDRELQDAYKKVGEACDEVVRVGKRRLER